MSVLLARTVTGVETSGADEFLDCISIEALSQVEDPNSAAQTRVSEACQQLKGMPAETRDAVLDRLVASMDAIGVREALLPNPMLRAWWWEGVRDATIRQALMAAKSRHTTLSGSQKLTHYIVSKK